MSSANASASSSSAGDIDSARCILFAIAGRNVPDRLRKAMKPDSEWLDLLKYIEGAPEAERAERPGMFLIGLASRTPEVAARMRQALADAEFRIADEPDDEEAQERPRRFKFIGSAAFAAMKFQREWAIRGVFVMGQPAIVGGPKKGMKTSVMIEFAISLATATPFCGEFVVPRTRKVLFLSGESGGPTIQETMRRVCKAKGIEPDEMEGNIFWEFTLPRLNNVADVEEMVEFIRQAGIEIVIIDPLYLCLTSGGTKVDPANLFDVGPILKQLADLCLDAGATPVIVHHLRKNRENPNAPPELEDLAFAGVQEFARQWIMLGRQEEYRPGTGEHKLWLAVGGSAGHSGCWGVDISEGIINDDFEGRDWNVRIARAAEVIDEVKQREQEAKTKRADESRKQKDERKALDIRDNAAAAEGLLSKLGKATKTSWRDSTGFGGTPFGFAFSLLLSEGRIRETEVLVRTGGSSPRPVTGYEVTPKGGTRPNPSEPVQNFNSPAGTGSGNPTEPNPSRCALKGHRDGTGSSDGLAGSAKANGDDPTHPHGNRTGSSPHPRGAA